MEFWLPLFFASAIGLALLAYVILDGYDLGVGILLPFATDEEKDVMVTSIGPFWDANETWIVLGIGVLLIAFPKAYGMVLTAMYLPATIMLIGLTLRGVAFDLRVKAGDEKKPLWNRMFFLGSLVAAGSQGWMLGDYITGLSSSGVSTLFSVLIAITMPALYVMLGAAWLLMRTSPPLVDKAIAWARFALWPMGLALLLVSIAMPIVSDEIAERWFSLPDAIGLLPIPLSYVLCLTGIFWLLRKPEFLKQGYGWLIFAGLIVITVMATIGLAFSIYPYIVLGRLTIWESDAAVDSLLFAFVGTAITLPMIIGYTIFVYRIFAGRVTEASEH